MKNSRDIQILKRLEMTTVSIITLIAVVVLLSSCGDKTTFCEYAEEGVPCEWMNPENDTLEQAAFKAHIEKYSLITGQWRMLEITNEGITQDVEDDVIIWHFWANGNLIQSQKKLVVKALYEAYATSNALEVIHPDNTSTYFFVETLNRSTLEISVQGTVYSFVRIQ
jgi:hypothetical protein